MTPADSLWARQIAALAASMQGPSVLDWATLLLAGVTTALWGVYVCYTRKTFQQIKRQTDISSQGFLVIEAEESGTAEAPPRGELSPIAVDLHAKWTEIIARNIPEAATADRFLLLRLANRGRSDIVEVTGTALVHVDPGDFLRGARYVSAADLSIRVEYKRSIRPDRSVVIPIVQLNSFPLVTVRWTLEYTDMLQHRATCSVGDQEHEARNSLAYSRRQDGSGAASGGTDGGADPPPNPAPQMPAQG